MYPNIRPAINPNSAEMIWSIVKIDFMLLFILSPQVIVIISFSPTTDNFKS